MIYLVSCAKDCVIAVFQWWTNRRRLKQELLDRRYEMLFDRRYKMFEAMREFFGSIQCRGNVEQGAETRFLSRTCDARFLFDKEMSDYVRQVRGKAHELQALMEKSRGAQRSTEAESNDIVPRILEVKRWFREQLDQLENRFSKFLQL